MTRFNHVCQFLCINLEPTLIGLDARSVTIRRRKGVPGCMSRSFTNVLFEFFCQGRSCASTSIHRRRLVRCLLHLRMHCRGQISPGCLLLLEVQVVLLSPQPRNEIGLPLLPAACPRCVCSRDSLFVQYPATRQIDCIDHRDPVPSPECFHVPLVIANHGFCCTLIHHEKAMRTKCQEMAHKKDV